MSHDWCSLSHCPSKQSMHALRSRSENYDSKKVDQDEEFYYLTIRLRARDFHEVIVDEGEARINYHLIEIESE